MFNSLKLKIMSTTKNPDPKNTVSGNPSERSTDTDTKNKQTHVRPRSEDADTEGDNPTGSEAETTQRSVNDPDRLDRTRKPEEDNDPTRISKEGNNPDMVHPTRINK